MTDSPYNARTDKISIGSRTGSASGDMIADGSNTAEENLGQNEERGERYKQQARRQRVISQRMRQLSEKDGAKSALRSPKNAVFSGANKEDSKPKLDAMDIVTLAIVAIFFDVMGGLISLFPLIGEVVNGFTVFPVATLTLYTMYKNRGIEFKETKVLVRFWGSLLIGFIPVISILPEYLLNVVLISVATKAEEKLKSL